MLLPVEAQIYSSPDQQNLLSHVVASVVPLVSVRADSFWVVSATRFAPHDAVDVEPSLES